MNSPRIRTLTSATPPYARLVDALRRRLREEGLAPGALVGTETEIAREGGVSRMTARRAVQALVDEGLVERRAGRGVFVRGGDAASRTIRFLAGNLLWAPAVRVVHAVQEDAPAVGLDVSVFDARTTVRMRRREQRLRFRHSRASSATKYQLSKMLWSFSSRITPWKER